MRRALVGVVLGVLALTLIAMLAQRLWLAPLLAHLLPGPQHREVRIEAATFGISLELEPVLHLHGVHVANAPWADGERPLLDAGEAIVVASWQTLWAERRIIK
ncbi:MAG: hypothetical protein M3Z16_09975, partial [Pseudomonadota bacterium]|nr:hypothetical protein [Pseudomonadota bacterium]